MENYDPAQLGYYWWVCESDSVDSLLEGTISFTPQIITDNQTGTFFIDYMFTDQFEGYHVKRSGLYPISVGAPMTVTVTNTNESGPGSFRQALADVSSSGEILFNLSYLAIIVVDSQLVIDRNVTVTGPESGELIIKGDTSAVITNPSPVFYVKEHLKNVNMSNLKISGGSSEGIYCQGSNLSLTKVSISNCSADGILCGSSNLSLSNVIISNNSTTGFNCEGNSQINMFNCTINDNGPAGLIDGISLGDNDSLNFVNSILWNNRGYNIGTGSITPNPNILVNVAYSNLNAIVVVGVIDFGELGGVILADPMFVDTANGDYRLQPGSPCIDAGIQDTMIIYNNGLDTLIVPPMAYNSNAPDMGALESPYVILIKEHKELPAKYVLQQNYPNPFNPRTNIEFSIPKTEIVTLKIYNILGQEVAILVSGKLTPGNYKYTWDATGFASGVYIYKMQTDGGFTKTKKLILIK